MILTIRQVTKVKKLNINLLVDVLISLLFGVILIPCNTYIKPDETSAAYAKPNDTLLLTEVLNISKYGNDLADIVKNKATVQDIRICAEKIALFQQKTVQKWDSLSKKKNILIQTRFNKDQRNQILDLSKNGNPDFEYINQIENQLVNQIELFKNVSTRSEDNEITTLAIILVPELNEQLKMLISLREKIAEK